MSSFLEKLKRGIGVEEETTGEEMAPTEDLEKAVQPKKKPRKIKKIKTLEQITQPVEPVEIEKEALPEMAAEAKKEEKKWPEPEGQLAVDVYQTDGELVIQSTIAGVKPEELEITAQGDVVTIKGKREKINNEEKNYFYQECYWGSFSREIILPVEADAARAEASMIEGVLTIRMPKIEREKKKKIVIK